MTTRNIDPNNSGITGIENNLENNKMVEYIANFMRGSDFLGFKYLIEEKIGKENAIPILSKLLNVNRYGIVNIDILEYIIGLGIEIDMSLLAFNSFMFNRLELFWHIKNRYQLNSIHIVELIEYNLDSYWAIGDEPDDEIIVKSADLIYICEIDLKAIATKNNRLVLDILLEVMPPNPKLIQLIIKQKAGYLLSRNRQNIKKIMNEYYPSSGWLRSINH